MKNILLKITYYIILIYLFFSCNLVLIFNQNTSVIQGFKFVLTLFLILNIAGALLSKLFFYIKFNIQDFTLTQLKKRLKYSSIITILFFILCYFINYIFCNNIYYYFYNNDGLINSAKYISKIYLLSLPLLTFETTYLNYCAFVKSKSYLLIPSLKLSIYLILAYIAIHLFTFTQFLYSRLAIDILFTTYYIIKLRTIINFNKRKELL